MSFTGSVEDRLAIRELVEAYADAVNRNAAEDWAATWAEDGVWNMPDYPQWGEVHGRAAIVATWANAMLHYPGVVLVATIGAIQVDGDRAQVRCYTSEVYDVDGVTKRDRGVYDDICVRREGRWLFQSRTFRNAHRQL